MKSLYLFCEYGISKNIIKKLKDNNITLEDIKIDNLILDELLGVNSVNKISILKFLENVDMMEEDYSVFDLTEFGITDILANQLWMKKIKMSQILNDKIIILEKFSKFNSEKILMALEKFKKYYLVKNSDDENNLIKKIEKIIKNSFSLNMFSLNEIKKNISDSISDDAIEKNLDQLIQNKIIKKDDETQKYYFIRMYSFINLLKYGLHNDLLNKLLKEKSVFEDIINNPYESLNNFNEREIINILDSINRMNLEVNDWRLVTDYNFVKQIINIFDFQTFSLKDLKNIDERKELYNEANEYLLNRAVKNKKIDKENSLYQVHCNKLIDEIEKMDELTKKIMLKRFNGESFEQISNEFVISKDKIKNIFYKEFKKDFCVKEDKYKIVFKKYSFNSKIFCEVFNESNFTYNYLYERYGYGNNSLIELLDESILDDHQKSIIKNYLNIITLDNKEIILSKINVIKIYLKKVKEPIEIEKIIKEYNNFIFENNLREKISYISMNEIDEIEKILEEDSNVIMTDLNTYKYFDFNTLDYFTIKKLKSLSNLPDGFYDMSFIFNNNIEIMEAINIKNKYELYSIYKKYIPNVNTNYFKIPFFLIGTYKCEKDFIKEKLESLAPIKVEDFSKNINDNFGLQQEFVKKIINADFSNYIHNDEIVSQRDRKIIEEDKKRSEKEMLDNKLFKEVELYKETKNSKNLHNMLDIIYDILSQSDELTIESILDGEE